MKLSALGLVALAFSLHQTAAIHPSKRHSSNNSLTFNPRLPFGPTLSAYRKSFTFDIPAEAYAQFQSDIIPVQLSEAIAIAKRYLKKEFGLSQSNYVVKNAYTSNHNGITHIYLRQVVQGLEVVNGDINMNVDVFGNIIDIHSSFYTPAQGVGENVLLEYLNSLMYSSYSNSNVINKWAKNAKSELVGGGYKALLKQKIFKGGDENNLLKEQRLLNVRYNTDGFIKATEAVEKLTRHLDSTSTFRVLGHNISSKLEYDDDGELQERISGLPKEIAVGNEATAKPAFIQLDDGELYPVWSIEMEQEHDWWNGIVSSETGEVLSLINWVSNASYNVFPFGTSDPSEGDRKMVSEPHDEIASPFGWHKITDYKKYTDTRGNNVFAQENFDGRNGWQNNMRPDGGTDLVFDYPINFEQNPDEYTDAAVTNLFYINNKLHDMFYAYGFDENSGNFQENNFGRGGKENDGVIANAQDGSGTNNANFATPPDGRRPRMRMYVWDNTNPMRDGDLDAGIITHEYSHGVSIRLTGGPGNVNCLTWGESGGMGEGWGDFFATLARLKPENTRDTSFTMGEYSAGYGIRPYPYSTEMEINPQTFKIMDRGAYWGVHAKGSVWATMLYEMMWSLIDKHGFTPDFESRDLRYGNTLALQLVIDGMKLQPCMPSFTDARDAILLADRLLTGGDNQCEIWKAFAKRGLGHGAKVVGDTPWGGGRRVESYTIGKSCTN
ncbi:Extracellular metalloproteinase 10 [Zancudomyces culisetae]|uniref:Extracellular metalloproteinase n=1 Tax=Zancudomyces culisetae TaxID=1213189 RepID=A0A1R1PE19_ZANCU|nr:Extracellular metalloproteinase 10 [Zancudomyces culisetae]|eukprot:OMH79201.1 Extracellular metalloproteinase 10 [Zancudomyces culisetae]